MTEFEKLKQMHEDVKNHPFREHSDKALWTDYRKLLREFVDQFWKAFKLTGIEYPPSFLHDFNAAIGNVRIHHIEKCIGYIHRYIETGEFKEYQTSYYTYVFDEDTQKFEPIMKKSTVDKYIKK
jgi:hypothetical protein